VLYVTKPESDLEAVITDCPSAWFFALERARRTVDKDLERTALENLVRLGVRVEFVGYPARASHDSE